MTEPACDPWLRMATGAGVWGEYEANSRKKGVVASAMMFVAFAVSTSLMKSVGAFPYLRSVPFSLST